MTGYEVFTQGGLRSQHQAEQPDRMHRSHHSRSRSPRRHHERRHHSHKSHRDREMSLQLPFGNRELSRNDLSSYRQMFALYLDIQKTLFMEDMDEDEIRGRWKSFIGKWNRGDLAEGWYDPSTLAKAESQSADAETSTPVRKRRRRSTPEYETGQRFTNKGEDLQRPEVEGDDEEEYGPSLPSALVQTDTRTSSRHGGPQNPTLSDLREKRELDAEAEHESRANSISNLRAERKADRTLQRTSLDEIAPRAEAGTRERQLEKKRELAASNKTFAEARERSPEFKDDDLMGSAGDDIAELKRKKKEEERKKSDREVRREEVLNARREEREQKLAGMREKEQKTMEMLKELANARFGSGGQ